MKKSQGVFCYLANKGFKNYFELFKSLFLLKKNFLFNYKHDVIVFHESNFNKLIIYIYSFIFNIEFRLINLNEHYYNNKQNIKIDPDLKSFGIGYRSMCFFFFSQFYKHIKDYKYYCRLDTDSFLTGKINFDFFQSMKDNNFLYGYIAEINEAPIAVKNLDYYLSGKDYYIKNIHKSDLLFENHKYNLRCIYNNFEVIDLSIFERNDIKNFINDIVDSNNIFQLRWGDAPLRTIMVSLFLDRDQIVRFKNIDYTHQYLTQKNGLISKHPFVLQNLEPLGRTI